MDELLRAELLVIDRSIRAELMERGELHTGDYHPEMQAVHRRHNARMRAILVTHGWPGQFLVGEDGWRAAGFVVQNAILDLDLQRLGIDLLAEAAKKREAEPFMLALLTDRVLMIVRSILILTLLSTSLLVVGREGLFQERQAGGPIS